ncbi:hypothetical protein CVT25_001418 [Psilocybe cyanescens]|uniref:THH1/TOM1/TOM3 domain-containing protein n=1 Tax=Psilocybe cyanescens TaxID=93625 RepID=A0A409WNE4_PSICY|nr:hypothetical protein CVT25_001418 [Psilocybe cyanescens]
MSTFEFPIPTSFQSSVISSNLNSVIIFTFLTGIYTMLYVVTMYSYITKMPANRGRLIVLSTISLLYILCMVQLVLQWYYINLIMITSGDTRESIFFAILGRGSTSVYAVFQVSFCLMFIVSDALLIWRCYHVWGVSLALTIVSTLPDQNATPISFKNLTCIQAFASFGTTALCTVLIGYKIHTVSRPILSNGRKQPNTRLSHVVKVIIESAAVYSLTILAYAIQAALPITLENLLESPLLVEGFYFETIIVAIAGMAPTVITARIALTSKTNTAVVEQMTPLSGLRVHMLRHSHSEPLGIQQSGSMHIHAWGILFNDYDDYSALE